MTFHAGCAISLAHVLRASARRFLKPIPEMTILAERIVNLDDHGD
jgi:hypothetical protein